MRVFAAVALAAAIGLAGGAAGFAQAADQDVFMVNRTGHTLSHLYVRAAGANAWDEDALDEDDTLDDGEHAEIAIDRGRRGCLYDLKVVTDEGAASEVGRINLCETSRIAIHWDSKTGTAGAVADTE